MAEAGALRLAGPYPTAARIRERIARAARGEERHVIENIEKATGQSLAAGKTAWKHRCGPLRQRCRRRKE
jgi:hypothetical protein